jgi:hypothetical protein
MSRPESEFATIRDYSEALAELVKEGLGDLPVQILVAPDSTLQIIARILGGPEKRDKPALMIELAKSSDRISVCIISADRLRSGDMSLPEPH